MRFNLYLVRHGSTPWNEENKHQGRLPGIGLSAAGIQQVQTLADAIDVPDLAAFVSSPLQRAQETATILRDGAGIKTPMTLDEAFTEWSIPPWDRLTFAEIRASDRDAYDVFVAAPYELSLAGAEMLQEVQERALSGVRALQEAHPDGTVAVVTHAAVIGVAVCGLLGLPLSAYRQFPANNASLSVIEMARQPKLRLFNWRPSNLE